ncbi:DUF1707 SHOCT-like domain-containing protein [Melissospora conviva]|uniref:DUF1707 SHOCT-like domain-containing protein n=1 Tax=Melissospora conviva TaxID=3388432 RepID=UPI003B78B93E
MEQRDDMRAADSDRTRVAERLQAALDEGRLDLHEYDDRLRRAFSARTYGDLKGLLDDLPAPRPADRSQLAPTASAWPAAVGETPTVPANVTRQWLGEMWGTYFSVAAITVGIWAVICLMSTELLYFWPGWVIGPYGAVLVVQTVGGLVTGAPAKEAAERARKEQARLQRRRAAGLED